MSQPSNVASRAEEVRRQTLEAIHALGAKAKAFGLPEPPAGLEMHRQKLQENTYRVLVVGEAKRGKSTFVNALIGRDVLPTDVDVATSQVFHVRRADRECYRLRFEDGSQQEIGRADLPRYGSQVVVEAGGVPRLDQIIRWIEVEVPARFLPPGVAILDTPGLGALYAAHAQITHRFVPQADAVIFVLDSQAPVSEPEVRFIEAVLKATRSLFFIQTRIDQFRKEAWQGVQARSQEVLQSRFGERLEETRVWPISSTNLYKAAATGDEDYLIVSRHKELAPALAHFLFRVAGWGRAAAAVVAAEHYHGVARQTLAGRLEGLLQESKQKNQEMQRLAGQRRQEFETHWGERGGKRRELMENVQRLAVLGKRQLGQVLQPGGEIERTLRARIEALPSVQVVNQLGEGLAGEMTAAALDAWRRVRENTQARCTELLAPFLGASEAAVVPPSAALPAAAVHADAQFHVSDDATASLLGKTRIAIGNATAASTVVGFGGYALLAFGLISPPVLPVIITGAALWAAFHGWRYAWKNELKAARQEALRHLANVLSQVRQHFFDVDLASSRFGLVDEYFTALERSLSERVASIASQRMAEAGAEVARLAEDARLDDEQRRARVEEVRRQLSAWDGLGQTIQALQVELQDLERSRVT
jgi:GTPase SAR1 family protein